DGIKRYSTEIVVDMQGTMQLLGGRPQGDAQQGQGGGNYNQSAPRPQQSRPQQSAPQQSAPQQNHNQPQQPDSRPAPQQQAPQPAVDFDSFDDDIPF
ncbi:Single-stranded DNA-binding protein, partial [Pseudomonas savastanoi pv. glycinea]